MALIKFLKRKKEQIDKAIPDFNIRQRAGQAVRSVGRTVSNIERGSQQFGGAQRSRLDSALAAQKQRQAEQANLRREREAKARARKLEQSQRRLDDLRVKQEQRNADREFKSKMAAQGIGGGRQFRKELFNIDNIRKSTGQALYENKPLKIARGAADFVAPITTGRNFIRTTGQALGAGIEEFGLRKEQKAINKENEAISKISDPKEALRRSQANSERARKLVMLREEKKRTVNVPKVLSDAALFAADTALSATGAKAAIKAGKPAAKQVFKEAVKRSGQRAGIGAGFGAGTSISEGERDVKQIAKQAGISAASNVALGGVIDVAPKVISKGAKPIQTALEQPKFKRGFASTKPKVGLEPKTPKIEIVKDPAKRQQIINSLEEGRLILQSKKGTLGNELSAQELSLIRKSVNKDLQKLGIKSINEVNDKDILTRYRDQTKAPVVKTATTEAKQVPQRAIEKAETIFGNLQDKKAGRNIPGFTPAPEAKPTKSSRIEVSKVKEKLTLDKKAPAKLNQKKINNLVSQYGNKFGFNEKQLTEYVIKNAKGREKPFTDFEIDRAFSSAKNKKDIKNWEAYISKTILKKREPEIKTITTALSNEDLPAPAAPKTKAQQQETKSAIDKAREQSEFLRSKQAQPKVEAPAIKLATKKSSEELAREAIGVQDTQKVVREKVFGREAKIPATPQQRTQFEINQAKRDAAIPEIKAVSKSEAERIRRERVRPELPEIDTGRTQDETNRIIREKVFGKEPALKPAQPAIKLAKPETFEDTITRVASKSAESAKKQPISPETPPVARVSTKEDISVSPEVKLNDRFPIKTTVDGKEKINYDNLIDFGTKINDEKSKNTLLNRIGLEAERIGAEYTKRTGRGFDSFVDELESGSLDSKAIDLYDEVSNLFNAGNKISTIRNNQITGNITNYFRRIKKEGLEKILTEGSQRNLGDILYTPGFGKKRTGALVDYEKTPAVIRAYFDEAIGPISKEQNALVKTANQIKNQINKSEIVDKDGVIKPTSSIKYVQTIKDNIKATAQNKYNDVKKAIIPGVRSVKNRVFQLADKQFYDDFLKPFNNAQRDYNNALQNATKLSEANVKGLAQGLGIKIPDKANKEQLLLRIAGEYKKQYYGPATETFMKNVANADIKEPNGLQLLEDIAKTYIGAEVKKNTFIDKLTGEIRLGYARGALGLNVGSAINNVLELKKVLSRAGITNTAGAIKDYIAGVDLRNKYGVATTSNIFQDEAFNLLKKVDPVLFSLFDFSENTKNRLFLSSLEKLGKKKGLQEDDLEYFVLKNFEQYGLAGGRAEDIGLFIGGKRPLTKTAFQFLQYPIKDTVAFADALSNGLKKAVKDKKLNEDLSYAMAYGLTSVAQMAILSQIIGQKGFGSQTGFTPFDFLKQVSSGDVTGPGADVIIKLGTWVNEIMQPESDKKEEKVRKAQTDMNRTFLMGVVPAYNQAWNRTGRYLQDRNRGYFETGSGNVANLVTDDVWGKIRAIILGGSYDPERQKYFVESQKSKSPNLGKQESAIFREVKEKGGIESAKQYFNSIMGKREADKALKSLEEGANAEKPAGMSDEEWTKIKATNEAYILSGLATTDDFINYYARDIDFGKSGAERTKNETKVFSLVNKLDSEDKFKQLSSEQKQQVSDKLLEKAGIPRTTVDYYNKANNTVVVKYQMALEEIEDNLSKNPNFDVINYLVQGRRKINTKQFASQEVLKMLEQDGIISEDQYKVLNKMNFLYLDGEFKDRSVAVKLKGKGKGKKPPKITLSRLMAGQQRLSDTQKIKGDLELVKLKSKPRIAAINLRKQTPGTVLRLAPVRKVKPKRLTIKNIRVK